MALIGTKIRPPMLIRGNRPSRTIPRTVSG
jgi:hypothetical protein